MNAAEHVATIKNEPSLTVIAICSCGWHGDRRVKRLDAQEDAYHHQRAARRGLLDVELDGKERFA